MDSTELEALISRVEKLDGPSAVIDAELYARFGGAPHTVKFGDRMIPHIKKGDPTDGNYIVHSPSSRFAFLSAFLIWSRILVATTPLSFGR